MYVLGSSHVDLQGGDVYGLALAATDSASILMSGGNVRGLVESIMDSDITITGGYVDWQIRAMDRGHITFAGGTIGTGTAPLAQIRTFGQGVIDIVGHDFAIDGVAVPFGEISALTGRITGTFASGELLDYSFERAREGTIRLISNPEPSTGLLIGFGLISLDWRSRRG